MLREKESEIDKLVLNCPFLGANGPTLIVT